MTQSAELVESLLERLAPARGLPQRS